MNITYIKSKGKEDHCGNEVRLMSKPKNNNIFNRCANMNQHHFLMTAVACVSKVQINMSYKGELQTLNKQGMRHHVCPGLICHTDATYI